jgi:hypothetical protein
MKNFLQIFLAVNSTQIAYGHLLVFPFTINYQRSELVLYSLLRVGYYTNAALVGFDQIKPN